MVTASFINQSGNDNNDSVYLGPDGVVSKAAPCHHPVGAALEKLSAAAPCIGGSTLLGRSVR